jgi:hypothetical protein
MKPTKAQFYMQVSDHPAAPRLTSGLPRVVEGLSAGLRAYFSDILAGDLGRRFEIFLNCRVDVRNS